MNYAAFSDAIANLTQRLAAIRITSQQNTEALTNANAALTQSLQASAERIAALTEQNAAIQREADARVADIAAQLAAAQQAQSDAAIVPTEGEISLSQMTEEITRLEGESQAQRALVATLPSPSPMLAQASN